MCMLQVAALGLISWGINCGECYSQARDVAGRAVAPPAAWVGYGFVTGDGERWVS